MNLVFHHYFRNMTRFAFLLSLILFIVPNLHAQEFIPMPKVPLIRQLFHINIDNAKEKIIQLNTYDGKTFFVSNDTTINNEVTRILRVHIHNLRANIELDSTFSDNDRFIWLRAIETLLDDYIFNYKTKNISSLALTKLILAFEEAMALERKQQSIAPIINNNDFAVSNIIFQNAAFANNVGYKRCKDYLLLKICKKQPENILRIVNNNPTIFCADSLITAVAYRNQEELYDYASSPNAIGDTIRNSRDSLVRIISRLATKNTGRMYFPFLDLLSKGKITIDSVGKALENNEVYYKLLVSTQIKYADRMQHADTPLVYKALVEKLRSKAVDEYIDEINALHDEKSDAVRFKKLDSLSPSELYYLCVLGEEEIYTSSYIGVYKRIFERMKVGRSDTLLKLVNYDYYKKFIKMAASYNELEDFLGRMDTTTSDRLMRNFVNDLASKNTLEDAVDVADSYSSISNKKLRNLILEQIQKNLFEDTTINRRSQTIYRLLYIIFLSMDPNNHIDLTKQLGINPIFIMPNKLLQDSSGRVIIQQFFYGDKDGKHIFDAFLDKFRNENWRIIQSPEWVEVQSRRGSKVHIYANKPLDEEQELDTKAQKDLIDYLDSLGLQPTVVIHRGHSYYLKSTIDQLSSSAKVILLGSCGGYQSLNQVLQICPQAHIISSKQVGMGVINQGLINLITEQLREGKDLNWSTIWKGLTEKFDDAKDKEKFNDYIPPYKNLGAIFIMAYNQAMDIAF